MKRLKFYFFGVPVKAVREATGFTYATIYRHIHGTRRITAEYAMKYHQALGIPLSDLRPDLWKAEASSE